VGLGAKVCKELVVGGAEGNCVGSEDGSDDGSGDGTAVFSTARTKLLAASRKKLTARLNVGEGRVLIRAICFLLICFW
jgi:hypothetical protein